MMFGKCVLKNHNYHDHEWHECDDGQRHEQDE